MGRLRSMLVYVWIGDGRLSHHRAVYYTAVVSASAVERKTLSKNHDVLQVNPNCLQCDQQTNLPFNINQPHRCIVSHSLFLIPVFGFLCAAQSDLCPNVAAFHTITLIMCVISLLCFPNCEHSLGATISVDNSRQPEHNLLT